jgi:hypothetical protein
MELSSKNKTILVLSDSHQEIDKLEYILKRENYDICVHLGDHFDSFSHNSEQDASKTCDFLKKWLFKPNFFSAFGNHDLPYLYRNPTTICSGYYKWKDNLITKEFGSFLPAIRDKFLWYLFIDDFLCSHAGVNSYHFPPNLTVNKDGVTKWLDEQIKDAEPPLINGGRHWLYGVGAARGGRQNIGGITWQDFDCEFEPIDGLKQLVGHSSHRTILNHVEDGNMDLTQADNLDIDCHLSQWILIQDGKIIIRNYSDL